MKTFYLFDPATGESKGTYDAQESPLEPGFFISPEHSTDIAPPTLSANEVAVFANGAWSAVPDFRGAIWFDQASGAPTEITAIGLPPSNLGVSLPPALQLAQAQAAQIAILTAAYNAAIQQPVTYMGTSFQADASSQITLSKVIAALAGQVPSGFYWLDQNNNQVAMTYAQLQGLASAMMAQGWAAFQQLQARKVFVRGASTVAAVQAIVW